MFDIEKIDCILHLLKTFVKSDDEASGKGFGLSIELSIGRNATDLTELIVFLYLARRAGESTLSDLLADTALSPPSLSRWMSRLSKRGYVELVSDEQDRRKKKAVITAKGLTALPLKCFGKEA